MEKWVSPGQPKLPALSMSLPTLLNISSGINVVGMQDDGGV